MDLMRLDKGIPDASTCRSLELGMIRCVDEIREQVRRDTGLSLTDAQTERILSGKPCSLPEETRAIVRRQGRLYTERLFSAVTEAGFDCRALPVILMGGGASLVKEQRPFKFFQIPVQFRKEFAKEARRHGLLYVPIRNKRNRSELELVVFADDAAKVNRILDNLNLDFVRSQAGEAAVEHPEETGGRAPDLVPPAPVRNEAVSIGNEQVEFELGGFDEAFSLSSAAREADTENFTQGRERNGNPSEPFSRGRGSSPDWEGDDRTPGRKESVKKLLREIRQEQAQRRTKREERRGPEHTAPARSRKRKKKRQKGR